MKKILNGGFTLIELLIVIAVIGVLAMALLIAINPIEQLNKSRDTRTLAQAKEVLQASERYWSMNEMYPWNRTTAAYTAASADPDTVIEIVPNSALADWTWVQTLQDTSEFKQGFWDSFSTGVADYGLFKAADDDTTYICFNPESDQFGEQAMIRCESNLPALPGVATFWQCGGVAPGGGPYVRDAVFICLP